MVEKGSSEYYELLFAQEDPYQIIQHPDLDLITDYKLELLTEVMPEAGTYQRSIDVGGGDAGIFFSHPQCLGSEFSVACDISFNALKRCREKHANTKLSIYFVVADAQNLPFRDDAFDFFFSGENLEHLRDADSGRDELYRVLDKRIGEGIITVPNEEKYILCPEEHLTNFTYESFVEFITDKFMIALERGIYLNEIPSHQLIQQENGLERVRTALALGRYNLAKSMAMIFHVYPRIVTLSIEERLARADGINEQVNVDLALSSSPIPFIGTFIDTLKRNFHTLSLFYVRALAERQRAFNRAIWYLVKDTVEVIESTNRNRSIIALETELDKLRQQVKRLEEELKQDGKS